MDLIVDLLFPRTDRLVAIEVAVVVPLLVALVSWAWRRGEDVRLFGVGVAVFTVAFMAARTLH